MKDETVPNKPKLLDELRSVLRMKHYSYRTEQSYVYWARRYILFHGKKHPNTMGVPEVRLFCSYLAEKDHVSASTQNQAFNALLFLYRHVIGEELGVVDAVRAKRPRHLPVVLSQTEVERVLRLLSGTQAIMATLLYGSGLRLMECHRLRVKDIDIEKRQIVVRDGKGFKDRITVLPETVIPDLTKHLERMKALHRIFTERGYGEVELPYALERKYPNAKYEWGWQYVFPAKNVSIDPRSEWSQQADRPRRSVDASSLVSQGCVRNWLPSGCQSDAVASACTVHSEKRKRSIASVVKPTSVAGGKSGLSEPGDTVSSQTTTL